MKFSHLLLFAAGVPLLASAQAQQAMPAAADANVPVTPLQYQSVFAGYVAVKDAPQSPDKGWVSANHVLLGDDAGGPASSPNGLSAAGASEKPSMPAPAHGKPEHKGAHR